MVLCYCCTQSLTLLLHKFQLNPINTYKDSSTINADLIIFLSHTAKATTAATRPILGKHFLSKKYHLNQHKGCSDVLLYDALIVRNGEKVKATNGGVL